MIRVENGKLGENFRKVIPKNCNWAGTICRRETWEKFDRMNWKLLFGKSMFVERRDRGEQATVRQGGIENCRSRGSCVLIRTLVGIFSGNKIQNDVHASLVSISPSLVGISNETPVSLISLERSFPFTASLLLFWITWTWYDRFKRWTRFCGVVTLKH